MGNMKITGYRNLTAEEIELMNEVKQHGQELSKLYDKLLSLDVDKRWLEEGRMDLQKGIMCWVRSIAKPESF